MFKNVGLKLFNIYKNLANYTTVRAQQGTLELNAWTLWQLAKNNFSVEKMTSVRAKVEEREMNFIKI